METFQSSKEYIDVLSARARLPQGFRVGTSSIQFFPEEIGGAKQYIMNLSLILLDRPSDSFHAVFTRNLFCGAPVLIGKNRLKEKSCRGIIANNKISNVAAPAALETQEIVLQTLARELNEAARRFFPASTGIIGWKLPATAMCAGIPGLIGNLQADSFLPVAEAIMTTDAYPKIRSAVCGDGLITAVAKGAGMIEPNMGTMLVFILTDIAANRSFLKECLENAVGITLNRISIDGDQSTSDMAIMLSSKEKPLADKRSFYNTLVTVLEQLREDIVRNGEGVSHVIQVSVKRAPSLKIAEGAGKAIVNSPLVKTAIFGNDPNVGRIIGALGDYFGTNGFRIPKEKLKVTIGNVCIFYNQFMLDGEKEKFLQQYLKDTSFSNRDHYPPHSRCVEIEVDLCAGRGEAVILGSDLTYDYVKENAAYRS